MNFKRRIIRHVFLIIIIVFQTLGCQKSTRKFQSEVIFSRGEIPNLKEKEIFEIISISQLKVLDSLFDYLYQLKFDENNIFCIAIDKNSQNQILRFDENGNILNNILPTSLIKIDNANWFSDYFIDPNKSELFTLECMNQINRYSYKGKLLSNRVLLRNYQSINGDSLGNYYLYTSASISKPRLTVLDSSYNIIHEYLTPKPKNNISSGAANSSFQSNNQLVFDLFGDTIYKMTYNSLFPLIWFNFNHDGIPKKLFKGNNENLFNYLYLNKSDYLYIEKISGNESYIAVLILSSQSGVFYEYHFIYNISSKKYFTYLADNTSTDGWSHRIPIPVFAEGNEIVYLIKKNNLEYFLNHFGFNCLLRQYLKENILYDSYPVLIKCKLIL
jgi:hypothetical protein